ncbi:MAG: flagellar basal body L-ring protein FlgH [Planctomycetota bacterium]
MTLVILVLSLGPAGWVLGQSSSLFLAEQMQQAAALAAATQPTGNGSLRADAGAAQPAGIDHNVVLVGSSLTAVRLAEPRIIRIHDHIGVIVRHRLKRQSDAKMEQGSDWDVQAKLAAWFRIHDRKWTQQGLRSGTPEVDFKTKNEMENKGKSDRKDIFETRLMAEVIDVKPNGNLVIFATSEIEFDSELQVLALTGECHKDNLSPDGTITSDRIANLRVKTQNEGTVRDATKRGWLKKFLDDVKPF